MSNIGLVSGRPSSTASESSWPAWLDKLSTQLPPFVAEMLATTLLILFTLAAFAALVYAFSSDSRSAERPSSQDGAANIRHLNPAISLALLLAGRVRWTRCVTFMVAQALGAVIAAALLPVVLPGSKVNPFDAMKAVSLWQALLVSAVCSATIAAVVTLTTAGPAPIEHPVVHDISEQQPHTVHEMNAVLLGCVMFVCAAAGSAVSGGYMHPFMAGVAAFHSPASAHWPLAPLLGPLVGAVLAGLPLRFVSAKVLPPFPAKQLEGKRGAA